MTSFKPFALHRVRGVAITLALCLLIGVTGVVSAFAEEGEAPRLAGPSEVDESPIGPATNPQAAEEAPHKGLDRADALALLESVFPSALEGAAGSLEGLRVEKFYSNHLALVVSTGNDKGHADESASSQDQPELLESMLPLRTENDQGNLEEVDLGLEHSEDELQPANPLVEIGIPEQLSEPISFPEVGIEVGLPEGRTDRTASTVAGSSAFFPNVATDSDLTVTPTDLGAETLTQLRSSDAPMSETYEMTLPTGAVLERNSEGGADVVRGEDKLLSVLPPSAYDTNGTPVPTSLSVDGTSVVITAQPSKATSYPILVDPVIHQWWNWNAEASTNGIGEDKGSDWRGTTNSPLMQPRWMGAWGQFGLNIYSFQGTGAVNFPEARYTFYVPRYWTDLENPKVKEVPTSYITQMKFSNLYWWIEEGTPYKYLPELGMGLWDENIKNWSSSGWRVGLQGQLTDPNFVYNFENKDSVKDVKQGVALMEGAEYKSWPRHLWIGQAEIYYSDSDRPGFNSLSGPAKWVNSQPSAPITYSATDTGLGVKQLSVRQPTGSGTKDVVTPTGSCVGSPGSPCPRTVESSSLLVGYEPSSMPQGEDWVKVYAADALSQGSPEDLEKAGIAPSEVRIKVDHTGPELVLGGTLTEQAKFGTKMASYVLKLSATDGTEAAPQSGVVETVVEVDGKAVDQAAPGCVTKSCAMSREWLLDASKYSAGQHTVKVTATDGVGLSTSKALTIQLQSAPSPTLSLSGSMTEEASVGATRPRYRLKANASAEAGAEDPLGLPPSYASSFGSAGSGTGQLKSPGDVAIDTEGKLWIADKSNNRVERFNTKGEYLSKFGSSGTGNGQFNRPTAVAIDAKGNLWVVDANNNRIQEFNEKGEFLKAVGSLGSGNAQFNVPEGIAIDGKGNIWVSDTNNGRVEKFNEKGEFVKVVSSKGSGAGQLGEPTGIAVGPGGKIWVADWQNNKVSVFNEAGEYQFQFGSHGGGNAQFRSPDAVDIDSRGNVWVSDTFNSRVQEFSQSGEYLTQFGEEGAGAGQFHFSAPTGIATDGKGGLWVTDPINNRLQRWAESSLHSQIATTVSMDGAQVKTSESTCAGESCVDHPEWILEAPSYSTGKHTVEVKATDGLGRSATKTFQIEIQRDTTKPNLEVSGSLVTAPEGWVEQETYGISASSVDTGFGVTSLKFKVDGAEVASATSSCPDGGCSLSIAKSVSMATYAGGAHLAEIVATDAAGNVATKAWTVNVDPEGHISTKEAMATLEAVDATSPVNTIGISKQEPEYAGTASGLGLETSEAQLVGTGTAAPLSISPTGSNSLTVEVPESDAFEFCQPAESVEVPSEVEEAPVEGEVEEAETQTPCPKSPPAEGEEEALTPITVTPISTAEGVTAPAVVNESAAVSGNSSTEVDTAFRPLYDGGLIFQAIRSAAAPEKYAWTVSLAEDQELKLIDAQHAEVYYSEGHPAFGITAEPAHDAIGTTVPTSLGVSENNVLTLTVSHRSAQYVYPVVAGTGWEGGFTSYSIEMPPNELPEEEEETSEETGTTEESGALIVAHVAGIGPPVATASAEEEPAPGNKAYTFEHKFKLNECRYDVSVTVPEPGPEVPRREAIQKCKQHVQTPAHLDLLAGMAVHGWFDTNQYTGWVWIPKRNLHCDKWGEQQPAMVHCVKRPTSASRTNIHLLGDYRFAAGKGHWSDTPLEAACVSVKGRLEIGPTYHQEETEMKPVRAAYGSQNETGEPCNWP